MCDTGSSWSDAAWSAPVGSGAGHAPAQAPDRVTPLGAMLRDFGEDWSIDQVEGGGCVAVQRLQPVQPPQPRVITAGDLSELRKRLTDARARQQF